MLPMMCILHQPSVIRRWLAFNSVGAVGIVIQMSVLLALIFLAKIDYLLATVLAVETSILHNFFWHERWTWADRTKSCAGSALRRLLLFHLTNGLLSIVGNLVLMRFFVGELGFQYIPANASAIAICSILNFIAGDRLVFRKNEGFQQKER
jgi:putative flippase GtrA